MKKPPLPPCPSCRGIGNFPRAVTDGETWTTEKVRCEYCHGYGLVTPQRVAKYWMWKQGKNAKP